ncbi:MAG: flagellar hook-associated protein FlgK [Gemmatimonadaceae bacterium]|nr:flagellar hook-associated protein FlgK [Gemmatimonadaceae bacterium]
MSFGLLSIARTALTTHQTALQTISQNIANAETPGYSRQEAVLQANTPTSFSYGQVGSGVSIKTIIRKRDLLLDDAFRSAAGQNGEAQMRADLTSQIEGIFGEPTDAGMSSALDQFWNSWSDLSASPNSLAARAVVQQRGRQLAQMFNDYDTALTQQRTSNLERLTNTVDQVNSLASQVASLNAEIVVSESNGQPNNDLRDLRDRKLDDLSKLAGTRVIYQANGGVSVTIGNSTLVDGASATKLNVKLLTPNPLPATPPTDIPVAFTLGDTLDPVANMGGQLAALQDVLNTDIPQMRGRLDAMASQLVTAVNTAHTAGYTFNGTTIPGTAAGNFFDAGTVLNPVRAATMRLDAVVANDPGKIAASGAANGPSDNSVAQNLAALRSANNTVTWTDANGATETGSFVAFFRGAMTRLGSTVSESTDRASVTSALTDQAETRRQSVSGVNTDEELVNMMRVQQSYTAASKMIKVADEMLQTLLSLVN